MKFNDLQMTFGGEFDEVQEVAAEQGISEMDVRMISEAARAAFVDGQRPEWFEEYIHLIELGWPWRVACYMAWAASARIGRKPATLEELATMVLGLKSSRTIYNWRKKYPTLNQVVAMLQAAPLWEHRREVFTALVEVARQPDYKSFNDRKLYLEMTGDYVPRSVQKLIGTGSAKDLSELSDEELDALLVGREGQEKSFDTNGADTADEKPEGEDWEDGEL